MRLIVLLSVSVLATFLAGCETPSATPDKTIPYVEGFYGASVDGSKGNIRVYLAEGNQSGPPIQNADVSFDGRMLSESEPGVYNDGFLPPPSTGIEHTLRISKRKVFDSIEMKLVAPSVKPVAITIANPPADWNAAVSPTEDTSYTVSPVGSWPPQGTTVLAMPYDSYGYAYQAESYRPTGSTSVVCTFPAGTVYTGFEVRNHSQLSVPGATSDSFFHVESSTGDRYGFDPARLPPFTASLLISYDGAKWFAWASFKNRKDHLEYSPESVSVAGRTLTRKGNNLDVSWMGPALAYGSSISYSFRDPDGVMVIGSVEWKPADPPVPVSSPPLDSIGTATSLTFPEPAAGWPTGSSLLLHVKRPDNAARTAWFSCMETKPVVMDESLVYPFAAPNTVTVAWAIRTTVPLQGYLGDLTMVGPRSSW